MYSALLNITGGTLKLPKGTLGDHRAMVEFTIDCIKEDVICSQDGSPFEDEPFTQRTRT